MMDFLFNLDWALFLSALVSSTLFPGGSEALLIYRLQDIGSNAYMLVAMATLGNVLGSMITYAMGRGGQRLSQRWSWLHTSEDKRAKAEYLFQRYGSFALLFAWLPIVGDPLCLVAGILRYPFWLFVVLVSIGKLIRYSLFAWAFL